MISRRVFGGSALGFLSGFLFPPRSENVVNTKGLLTTQELFQKIHSGPQCDVWVYIGRVRYVDNARSPFGSAMWYNRLDAWTNEGEFIFRHKEPRTDGGIIMIEDIDCIRYGRPDSEFSDVLFKSRGWAFQVLEGYWRWHEVEITTTNGE